MTIAFSPSAVMNIRSSLRLYGTAASAVPPWVESGATVDLDFANARHYWNGTTSLSQALLVSRSGATLAYAYNADGTWSPYPVDTARVGIGTGLLLEPSTSQRMLNNSNFAAGTWTASNLTLSDSGATPVYGGVPLTMVTVPVGATALAIPAGITSIDVYAFGPDGNGAAGTTNTNSGGGGGGGAFAYQLSVTVTPSTTLDVQVPAGGSQTVAFLKNNAGTIVCQADCGLNASGTTAGAGGLVANSVGQTKLAGGAGGAGSAAASRGGGGGGGRPLPTVLSGLASNYSGRTGSSGTSVGGGGGATNTAPLATNSTSAAAGVGGNGGKNALGAGDGAGGTTTVAATAGTNGGGGGGGSTLVGINGANGSVMAGTLTYGGSVFNVGITAGGGGGGGLGGNGGAGGGGGGCTAVAAGTGGAGGDAVMYVVYGSSSATTVTATAPGAYLAQTYSPTNTTYTGGISGTVMTVSAVVGVLNLLSIVGGAAPDTKITAQTGGTPFGAGTYTVSISQTVAPGTAFTELLNRVPSLVVRPQTVTGAIYLSQDGGVHQTDIAPQLVSGKWVQVSTPYDAQTAPEWRLTIANSGDVLDIIWAGLEDHIYATSPIPTAGTTVTRGSDFVRLNLTAFPTWIVADAVTVLQPVNTHSTNISISGLVTGGAWTWSQMWGASDPIGTITASISGTLMTVTAVSSGTPGAYVGLSGVGVTPGTQIFSQTSGSAGSTGTYSVLPSQTVGSVTMTLLDTQAYTANAVPKNSNPSSNFQTGVTVVDAASGLIYGFDPLVAEYTAGSWSRAAFSATSSLKTGVVALDGDVTASSVKATWADSTQFTEFAVGMQMPGATNLVGYCGRLTIISGTAWTAAQLAAWSAQAYP